MIHSEHISREELIAVLENEFESGNANRIEDHLQQCDSCRCAMEQLAARSEIWQKTPRLLKPKNDSGNYRHLGSQELETTERPAGVDSSSPGNYGYAVGSLLDPPQHPEMLGRIGRYDIEREIGRGGMGIVFKAHDSELNRPLAVKVLAPHLANHGPARQRFAQEARAAAAVLHPNVIAVHDVGNDDKTPYIVMPYIAGHSLQTLVDKHGPFSEIEIVRVALQIAAGLTPAHSQGLVHRDIKPANILMERGANRVIITDFGLARAEDDASLTKTGWLTGTPNYMSPEQTRGARLDQRSDLFSFGSLIYFLATGRLPFRSESPLGVLNRIQNDEPTPARQVNNGISKTLGDVISVLLQKDPAKRFQSAAEIHDVLEQHLAHLHQPDMAKPPRINSKTDSSFVKKMLVSAATLLLIGSALYAANGFLGQAGTNGDKSSLIASTKQPTAKWQPAYHSTPTISRPRFDDQTYTVFKGMPTDRGGKKEFEQGLKYLESGKYKQAIAAFTIAAKHEAFEQPATYNIACGWALLGDKSKAFEFLNRAVDLGFVSISQYEDDKDIDAVRDDERFQILLNRLEDANEANRLISKGKKHQNREEYGDAVELYREALELDPKNAHAMLNLGYSLHMQQKIDEAMKWHLAAAESNSEAALGNYNLACAYSLKGDTDQALKFLNRAFEARLDKALDASYLENDSDLDNIRNDKRYKSIVEELEDWDDQVVGTFFRVEKGHAEFTELAVTDWTNLDETNGDWDCRILGDRARITLNLGGETGRVQWGYSSEFDKSDFAPPIEQGVNQFRLKRKFGELMFTGELKGRKGSGTFRFEGDKQYVQWLDDQGLKDIPEAIVFQLFMSWQDERQMIRNLKELQSLDLDEPTLNVLMAHSVDANLVEDYTDADLDPADHLVYIVWRVTPELIESYNQAGLELERHKKFINQRVKPSLIKEYRKAGFDIDKYGQFITWRVQPQFLTRYISKGLDLEEYKEFISKRVEPDLIDEYRESGFDLNEFSRFIESRVPPSKLLAYRQAGLDFTKHNRFIRQHIPAELVQSYREAGLDLKRFDNLLQARVAADAIKAYQDAGLSIEKYKDFLIQRVPTRLLLSYRNSDLKLGKHRDFIQGRVPAELLIRYREAGLDLQENSDFIKQRMEPDEVRKHLQGKHREKQSK